MKKLCTLVSLLICLGIMCGCSTSGESPVNDTPDTSKVSCYMLSCSNGLGEMGASSIPTAKEVEWWNGSSFTSSTASKEAAAELSGITYTGTYRNSKYDNYNSFATDYYDGDDGLTFGLNANDGSLVYLNLKTLTFFDTEPALADVPDPEEKTLAIARDTASLFVSLENYEMLEPSIMSYQPEDTVLMSFYTYTFVQKINGENSSAYLSIQVTSKGNLASVVVGDINAFSAEKLVEAERYKDVQIDKMVYAKAQEALEKTSASSPEILMNQMLYALTPKGEVVVCVRASGTYSERGTAGMAGEEPMEADSVAAFEFVLK